MEPLVDTVMEDLRWEGSLPPLADSAARATLAALCLDPARFEIVVMGCDDARIATLNAGFRGKPVATNVLSWPSEDRAADAPGGMPKLPRGQADHARELGDIAISYDSCAREAAEQVWPDIRPCSLVHQTWQQLVLCGRLIPAPGKRALQE